MIRKTLLFRNLVDNVPKNIGLYCVGILFLVISGYSFETVKMVLGLIAFLISYSSVYVFNDIFDISEDGGLPAKCKRKPLVQGSVEKSEAATISLVLLIVGLSLSLLQNLIFFGILSFLIILNVLYSIPLVTFPKSPSAQYETDQQNNRLEIIRPTSFKHTIAGLPLVFAMQFLKILLPWTITPQLIHFPFLFAVGFSLTYVVLFKGYKMNRTIGGSVISEPLLFSASVIFFFLSMLVHPEPIIQASIFLYLLTGVVFFRKHHLVDKTVIILSPVYIIVGVLTLFWLILYI